MSSVTAIIDRICAVAKLNTALTLAAVTYCTTALTAGTVFTAETTDINSSATNDVSPAATVANDASYFGYTSTFSGLNINVYTAGVGDAVSSEMVWEYYNGALWVPLACTDGTAFFTVAGSSTLTFAVPSDWATVSVNSQTNYYVRARATAAAVYNTTAPALSWASIRTSTTERPLVLSFLQEAAARVCAEAAMRVPADTTVTLTQGTPTYTLNASPFPTDMVGILSLKLTDTALTSVPLDPITMHEMDGLRIGSGSQASPYVYAVDWPNLVLYPTPGASSTLAMSYVQDAPTLSDNTANITFLPEFLQWGCLYNFALSGVLSYKKQPEAADYMNRFLQDRNAGLPALRRWKASAGGRLLPSPMRITHPRATTSQDLGY